MDHRQLTQAVIQQLAHYADRVNHYVRVGDHEMADFFALQGEQLEAAVYDESYQFAYIPEAFGEVQ